MTRRGFHLKFIYETTNFTLIIKNRRILLSKLTHEDYLKRINVKNPGIKALEEYIDTKTKILHKCVCGNIWKVMPKNILKGQRCGCKATKIKSSHNDYVQKLKYKDIGRIH